MVNWSSKKLGDYLLLANGVVLIILINALASQLIFRLDLTEEKRYSIKQQTQQLLRDLDDNIYIEVYLEGELNAGFRRFQKAIRETLEEFRVYSRNKIQYTFVDPEQAISEKARQEFMVELSSKGIQATNVIDNRNGQRVEKLIFPGAVVSYGGSETGVMLLKGNKAGSPEEEINQSIEGVEFELANAIYKLVNENPRRIGLLQGQGEADSMQLASFRQALLEIYDVAHVSLDAEQLKHCAAVVIIKPTSAFSQIEKYQLDQYIMGGGRVLFLLDKLDATMDSASQADYMAFPYDHNLDDMLFRYGVRINADLVQDRNSSRYPIVIGQQSGGQPRIQFLEWPFFPLINHYADHPITTNLDAVITRFASSVDTVKAAGVKKTPLMFSSQYSRTVTAPVNVSVQSLRRDLSADAFTRQFVPVAYLLEGKFSSLFKNRFIPEGGDSAVFKDESVPTRMVVVADGDLALNVVNPRTGSPQPLGFDPFMNQTFANEELLLNMIAFLTDENGLINARNKEIKIRPLDKQKIVTEKNRWRLLNLVIPIALVIVFGLVRSFIRKKQFTGFEYAGEKK